MPANRHALIRYRCLDDCLRNRYRQWTLDNLIEKVSEAMYEYEGGAKGISRRTVQADLQMMRSDKLGYNAPIVVREKKYYTYEDPGYSITQIPLTGQDLTRMNEAVEMLRQFKGFSHFRDLTDVVQKLEDHVYAAAHQQRSVIEFEKNDHLKGLTYLDALYQAIIQQRTVLVTYQSFKAREPSQFPFHVWWLKEFKNRWFAVGVRANQPAVMHLALDRIADLAATDDVLYRPNSQYTPDTFYNDVIGVTVSSTMQPCDVRILVSPEHAPYVETKPLHASQRVLQRRDDGVVFSICVQLNFELEREILGFGDGMVVLAPERLRRQLQKRLQNGAAKYEGSV